MKKTIQMPGIYSPLVKMIHATGLGTQEEAGRKSSAGQHRVLFTSGMRKFAFVYSIRLKKAISVQAVPSKSLPQEENAKRLPV